MRSLLRFFFPGRSDRQLVRKNVRHRPRHIRQGLEFLEDRLLLNSHPANSVPHHIHPHLAIFIDGQNFEIPASVGHASPGPIRGTPNENAHTHTNDGIIHYNEATAAFRDLKEFFDTWGGVFSQTQIKVPTAYDSNGIATQFLDKTVDGTHALRFFVNGSPSSDFDQYEPEDGDQMVISYETIAAANAPTLNPINNVTMVSEVGSNASTRTFFVPLDATDSTGSALTYSVTSTNPNVTATLEPSTNRYLQLNVSGRDIDGNAFTGNLVFQLFDDLTPNTVNSIVSLVQNGFYTNNFVSTINAAQEVPATSSTATGTATLSLHPGTNTFDIDIRVQGITLAQLQPSHIHNAARGVDGPIIIDLGGASEWVQDGTGIRRTIQGGSISAANMTALLNGETYINIHTIANPDGEIRGQLTHLPFHRIINDFMAQGGSRTGNGAADSTVADFADEFNAAATFTGFGQLAMANGGDDTNDTQFFITDTNLSYVERESSATLIPPQSLNFQHTIFGQLVGGFDIFNKMMLTPVHANGAELSAPNSDVTINSATMISNNQDGVLRLTAPANFTGSSNITVTATSATSQTAQRNFVTNVIADAQNDRPFLGTIPNPSTRVNTPVTITIPNTDLERDTLAFIVRDPNNFANVPANVSVSINQATGQATLTPATGFSGTVDLLVGVRDGTRRVDTNGDGQITTADTLDVRGNFDTQVVRLTVTNSNLAPTANAQTVTYQLNTASTITLTGDDGDADATQTLTFIVDTLPTGGTLRDSNQAIVTAGATLPSATLTYTPTTGSTANDQFTFHVRDNGGTASGGQDTSPAATVTLVTQVNQAPTTSNQTVRFQTGTATTITLTGADGDNNVNQTISFVVDTLPENGTLRNSNNAVVVAGATLPSATLTFTPDAGFTGTDDFTFHVRDDGGTANGGDDTSNTATITLRGFAEGTDAPDPKLRDRVLIVQGTRDDDVVEVELSANGNTIEVSVNGAAVSQFPVNGTDRIRIRTGAGDDEVTVSEDVELAARMRGGEGDDILTGGSGDDVIRGRRGNDEIDGGEGDDKIFAGRGDDDLTGGDGLDRIRGRKGDDTIDGGDDDDKLRGGSGDDEIDGGAGTDTVHGGIGEDDIEDAEQEHDSNRIASMIAERDSSDEEEDDSPTIAAMTADRLMTVAVDSSRGTARHDELVDAILSNV